MGIIQKLNQLFFVKWRILKYQLLSDLKIKGVKPNCFHPLLLKGKGMISFGKEVQIGVVSSPNFYSHYSYLEARFEESEIVIGDNVAINNAFSAVAFVKISIGSRSVIGVNCSIIDTDGHDLRPNKRTDISVSEEVNIGVNVFIGSNVSILKGVSIGENSVIGNGSVVTRSIPDNVVAAGNPARVIRSL